MKSIQCQIFNKFSSKKKAEQTLKIENNGFLVFNDEEIRFIEYISNLEQMNKVFNIFFEENKLLIIPKFSSNNFAYQNIINDPLQICWKNFDQEYEPMHLKDMIMCEGSLYYFKLTKINDNLKLNPVQQKDKRLSQRR